MIVYDAEIASCIPDPMQDPVPGLVYCEGWQDFKGMGISVVCAYVADERMVRVFLEDNLATFAELTRDRVLVGFNNQGFDDHLLEAFGIATAGSYDVLAEIRAVADGSRTYIKGVTRAGRKLDDVCAANLGGANRKTGDGAFAPVLWQQGKRGQVIDYCLKDVLLLAKLIAKLPSLIDPPTGITLQLPRVGEHWTPATSPAEVAS
jgi:hypothetical protein